MARLSAAHLSPPGDADAARLPLPPDTYSNEFTYQCAQLAAGSAAEVAATVARGDAPCGAAIVRPPGAPWAAGQAGGPWQGGGRPGPGTAQRSTAQHI
jgi:acetoin utilization deacetylase AcuC-like enzyme